jgi:serralysin
MATVSDITLTPFSGLNHIDALLDKGPDWNYLSNPNGNILYYTFSTASANEEGVTGQATFSFSQQAATRTAFNYLKQVTGIEFQETANGGSAQIHLANIDIEGYNTVGLASWRASYSSYGNNLSMYNANAYVYLDNVEFRVLNQDLTPGGSGYETLLHELGHALGLKHPFYEETGESQITLDRADDNTGNTLMSYTHKGGPYSAYSPYDIAALNWLYGGDGLRGELGINSNAGARYITGTSRADTLVGTAFNDTLQGNGGDDMIDGGAGRDTAVFNGIRSAYALNNLADGALAVSNAAQGTTTLRNIEVLQFADMSVERASVFDTTPPVPAVVGMTLNANDYVSGNKPTIYGSAELNSTVQVFIDGRLVTTVKTDENGMWNARAPAALADGMGYNATALVTDAAGNVSAISNTVKFNIDSIAPSAPSVQVALSEGSNKAVFYGVGEAGTRIELYRDGDFIQVGTAQVRADGTWQLNSKPLPDGAYTVFAASVDKAGNATSGNREIKFAVDSAMDRVGTDGADTFTMGSGSVAVSGGKGIDIAVFEGARANYTIAKDSWGSAVTGTDGNVSGLYDVERLQFSDGWQAIDDGAASIFRLYRARPRSGSVRPGLLDGPSRQWHVDAADRPRVHLAAGIRCKIRREPERRGVPRAPVPERLEPRSGRRRLRLLDDPGRRFEPRADHARI